MVTTWRVDAVCVAPIGQAPYVYTDGLDDAATGVEVVVAARPESGHVAGGVLTDFDARALARTWSEAIAAGGEPSDVILHDGLTHVRPVRSIETTAAAWAEGRGELHLCTLAEWTPVREILWECAPVTSSLAGPPSTQEVGFSGERLADMLDLSRDWRARRTVHVEELLGGVLVEKVEADPRPFARMASLGFLQLEGETGPMAVRSHLHILAERFGMEDRVTGALAEGRDVAARIAAELFPPTSANWEAQFDARCQGLEAVLCGLFVGLALDPLVPAAVLARSVATGMHLLVPDRYEGSVPATMQAECDEFGWRLASCSTAELRSISAGWEALRRFEPAHVRVGDRVLAMWLGAGAGRPPEPSPAVWDAVLSDRDDNISEAEIAFVRAATRISLMASLLHGALTEDEWDLSTRLFAAVGVEVHRRGGE